MATTKYVVETVSPEGEVLELVATKAKKQLALDLARDTRKEQTVGVRVTTTAGNVVADLPAPKKIKMSKPYTRSVELPEGFEVPREGLRVAYARPRKQVAIFHDAEGQEYIVANSTGEELGTFGTTREAGRFIVDELAAPAKA